MNRMIAISALAWAMGGWGMLGVALAQGPLAPAGSPRAYPYSSRPTLSPYLDYFRTPLGPLDNYHEFVRPRVQLQQQLQQQESQLRRQTQGLHELREQIMAPQRTDTVAPTGTGARFFHHSHFYPSLR